MRPRADEIDVLTPCSGFCREGHVGPCSTIKGQRRWAMIK